MQQSPNPKRTTGDARDGTAADVATTNVLAKRDAPTSVRSERTAAVAADLAGDGDLDVHVSPTVSRQAIDSQASSQGAMSNAMTRESLHEPVVVLASPPRERLAQHGVSCLSDDELVALLLSTGHSRETVLELAQRLLRRVGGLEGLSQLEATELMQLDGIGIAKASRICAAVELGRRVSGRPWQPGQRLHCSRQVFEHYRYRLRDERRELFWVVLLDARNRLLGDHEVSRGSLVASIVHPREVFRPAIQRAAASVICLHNHPSGDPSYSRADVAVTERLFRVGVAIGIPLLDHIVVGAGGYTSLADSGVSPFDNRA